MSNNLPDRLLNSIKQQVVCSKCESEYMAGYTDASSLQNYSKLDIGFSDIGIQVWCHRHDVNVVHIDFDGNKLQADFRCLE